jgi:FkbM family methyltransferase
VVDVGANRGQFALVARRCFPEAHIICFEPLAAPAQRFRRVFATQNNIRLHQCALGAENGSAEIHVSAQDDSSSLLPITELQSTTFPGTEECRREEVEVRRLDSVVEPGEIVGPALLKLDVQGYELQALKGCGDLLRCFRYVFAECSFLEFYQGQALGDEVSSFLRVQGFRLAIEHNLNCDSSGKPITGDFLFFQA